MFLVVGKETSIVHGLFNTEPEAIKYKGNGDSLIIYLPSNITTEIQLAGRPSEYEIDEFIKQHAPQSGWQEIYQSSMRMCLQWLYDVRLKYKGMPKQGN